jgi:hypothetical protein
MLRRASAIVVPTVSRPWLRRIRKVVPEVLGEPNPLVVVDGDSLVVVVAERAHDDRRLLRQRQQPVRLGADAHAGARVGVNHAGHVGTRVMDRAVDDEAGAVDAVRRLAELSSLVIDDDQRRRRHLVEHQAVGIDQEPVLAVGPGGQSRTDVREDQVTPAIERNQPVAGGEIDPRPPFTLVDNFPQ